MKHVSAEVEGQASRIVQMQQKTQGLAYSS